MGKFVTPNLAGTFWICLCDIGTGATGPTTSDEETRDVRYPSDEPLVQW